MFEFWKQFELNLFLGVLYSRIGPDNGLALNRWQAIIWANGS